MVSKTTKQDDLTRNALNQINLAAEKSDFYEQSMVLKVNSYLKDSAPTGSTMNSCMASLFPA